jgi:HEXXH motif-containing protein
LLSRLGPVADDSDKRHYFSPAVKRDRPLSKIIIGYHAFANIVLFYRSLLENGWGGDEYCRATEARLTGELHTFEDAIRDNPALTDLGRDLCEPLFEQVRATQAGRANA